MRWDREKYPAAPFHIEHSIGEFYAGVAYYVFDDAWCEGKLMGLAPYGRPGRFNASAFDVRDGRAFMRTDWLDLVDPARNGRYACFHENFQYYADLALWAQTELENVVLAMFQAAHERAPHQNVAYAGGVALNAVTNHKVTAQTDFADIYIQPAAGDNGLAVGCCYYGWMVEFGRPKVAHSGSTYFGRIYPTDTLRSALDAHADQLEFYRSDDVCADVAELLAEDEVHVVGWYQGGAEFGPRALGNRSILANPMHQDIRNYVNRKIKTREDFRPFAPSVLEEAVGEYFDNIANSPYMIMISQTHEEWKKKIPGVVHKDGTARVQTVSKELNPKYHRLIEEFGKRTGVPILVNTSFNGRGQPIVETADDALAVFLAKKNMDTLVLGDYIVRHRVEAYVGSPLVVAEASE